MSVNQKEAVYSAAISVGFEAGELSSEMKQQIISILTAGFESGEVTMSDRARDKYIGNPKELKNYTSGLVNNHFRKDLRLNGGTKYVTKNPGSRAGNGDTILKNLKALRTTMIDADKIDQVDKAIYKRQEELKVEKSKTVEVDVDLIPAELRETLGL